MTPRLLVTADLHLTAGEADSYRHDFQAQLREIARREGVDRVIILGDLTEEKDRHPAWLVNKMVDHIRRLADIADVTILRGNHDYENIDSPFFEFLGRLPHVRWISKPMEVDDLLFLPHTRDYKRDWKGLQTKGYRWIFAHNAFEGADQGHGRKAEGIPLSFFHSSATVISGDIHIPQRLGCVVYVGAPYRVYYGDEYNPRLLILDGKNIKPVQLIGPQKHSCVIQDVGELLKLDVSPGDMVKVKVELEPDAYDLWSEIRKEIYKWGDENGIIVTTVRPKLPLHTLKRKEFSHQDDAELIRLYVKRRQADERTLKTMLSLTNED